MKIIAPILILFLLFSYSSTLSAQEYLFDAQLLTPDDGLAHLLTTSIHKDKQGFLWIGTGYGLNRYDGYNFNLYTQAKNGLYRNDRIYNIRGDEEGNLWLFYPGAGNIIRTEVEMEEIDIFNPTSGKSVPFDVYFGNKAPFKAADVNMAKVIDPKNRIWITTTKGQLFLYHQGIFKKIFERKHTIFQHVSIDQQDNIWIAWENNLIGLNASGEVRESFDLPSQIGGLWTGEKGTLWLATVQRKSEDIEISFWKKTKEETDIEPCFFLGNKGTIKTAHVGLSFMHRDQRGYWYLGMGEHSETGQRLELFNEKGRRIFDFSTLLGKNLQTRYMKVFEDAECVWFATTTGIIKTRVEKNPFQWVHRRKGLSDCRGMTEDETGNLYFLNGPIYQQHAKTGEIKQLSSSLGTYPLVYDDSILWAGSYNSRLGFQVDVRTMKEIVYPALDPSPPYALLKTKTPGRYLVGKQKGLAYVDLKQNKVLPFDHYKPDNYRDDLLKTAAVYHFHKNESGIWLATDKGVFLMNEEDGILQHFDESTGDLPFNHIRHIYEDVEGVFWLATKGGGVIQWQPDDKHPPKSRQFTTQDGLSNNYTYAIYGDDYGNLWIPSDKGLMCMDKTTYQVKTYLTEDGLLHNEFNLASHYQSKDSTLYFGGLGGLIAFHPSTFANKVTNQTPFEFTGYYLLEEDEQEMTNKTELLQASDGIVIQPTDKLFELQFALLDYENPEHHNYVYKIEGYTNYWSHINENYIRITNLPYGDYTLRIKGQNSSQGWSEQELSLRIHVLTPFYLRWWFLAAMLLAVIGMTTAAVKWRISSLKKDRERLEKEVKSRTRQIEFDKQTITEQAKALQQLDKAKTRFFSNITHEFRTPLTLITGPLEQLLLGNPAVTVRKKVSGVLKNARHLLNLINQLLDLSKLEGGQMKIEVTHGDMLAYTRELVNRFKPLADKKEQQLIFETSLSVWETRFDKHKWNKIVYNLLSNAIKFTPKGETITVSLEKSHLLENEMICLVVKDTGIGIKEEALKHIFNRFYQEDNSFTRKQDGTGIGLALVKELVELQGGEIAVSSKLGEGTSFEIKLPALQGEPLPQVAIPLSVQEPLIPLLVENEKNPVKTAPPLHSEIEKLEILIIEDNEEMREYIHDCIDPSTYNITEAGDGEEGIQKALALIPDLIISDVMMPKKDGFEVVKAIRSNSITSHIPLILLTAKASLESRMKGIERGADAYLTKPFSPQELALRIQKLIETRQLLQQRYTVSQHSGSTEQVEKEDEFITELRTFITENIQDSNLYTETISKHFAISRMQLYRKLKALTNQGVSEFIRSVRIEIAFQLIKEGKLNLSEIAYETGFSSLSHFSRTFKKVYGKSPSEVSELD